MRMNTVGSDSTLDWAAYQCWVNEQYDDDSLDTENDHERLYDGLRIEASKLYYELLDEVQSAPDVRTKLRLVRYLRGDSVGTIALVESPNVTRQAIHKCLQIAIRELGIGVKTARLIWIWGQDVYSSTAITHCS